MNQMLFGLTLFGQNYYEDPVGETEVDYFWLFMHTNYIYIHIYENEQKLKTHNASEDDFIFRIIRQRSTFCLFIYFHFIDLFISWWGWGGGANYIRLYELFNATKKMRKFWTFYFRW